MDGWLLGLCMDGLATSLVLGDSTTFVDFLNRNAFWVILGSVAIVGILAGTATSIFTSMNTEKSRREIAAYIAEGSMTPEQGERLLRAGKPAEDA